MLRLLQAITLTLAISSCVAQTNFKRDYLADNPIQDSIAYSHIEKVEIHNQYLQEAIEHNDTLRQLYGLLYLFTDHYRAANYVELKRILLKCEKLISTDSKPEWQGALRMRRAYMLKAVNKDYEAAINQYQEAIDLCTIAKDSLCIGESLEQISNLNKNLKKYDLAEEYFKRAIPIIERHATPIGQALAFNNYSLLASAQNKYYKAEKYMDKAILIIKETKDTFRQVMYISNKASIYLGQKRFKEAIEIYLDLLPINIKNSWADNLLFNYAGLVNSYEDLGDFEKSNIYLQKYYELKDSLNGASVQEQIEQLEAKDKFNRNALILNEKKIKIQESKLIRDRLMAMVLLLGLSCLGLYYFWYITRKNLIKEQESHLNYIHDLKQILKVKNNEISTLNVDISTIQLSLDQSNSVITQKPKLSGENIEDYKIFDTRIINDDGITAFKAYFDKIYPGLLIRARKQWPSITDAEERLFMLVKLRIKSKEASEILGISQSSIKKSRNRLRKRLEIDTTVDLEVFVQEFN